MPLYEVNDFSKGITDAYLEGDKAHFQKGDNLVLNEYKDLVQRPGLTTYEEFYKQIPAGTQRIDGAYYFDNTIFVKSGAKIYYMEAGDTTWTTLDGPNTSAFLGSGVGSHVSWSEWRGHLFVTCDIGGLNTEVYGPGTHTVKIFRDSNGDWTLFTAGLPIPAGTFSPSNLTLTSGNADSGFFRWYSVIKHAYVAQVEGVETTFIEYGRAILEGEGLYDLIDGSNYASVSYTAISNSGRFNYPTVAGSLITGLGVFNELYRTEANGFIPKLAKTQPNGTTTSDTSVPDGSLGADLYIGDLRDPITQNYAVPLAQYTAVVDGRMCYLAASPYYSTEAYDVTRYMESKPNQPGAVPEGNFVNLGEPGTGLSYVGKYPIAFSNAKCWRMENHFDLYGRGGVRARLISDREGCVSHKGIVRMKDGIFYPSPNGFCWTDGHQVRNITEVHLLDKYAALLNKRNITGTYVPRERRIYWAVESPNNSPSNVNNELWILDLRWSDPNKGAFTTASMTGDNLQANVLEYVNESFTSLSSSDYDTAAIVSTTVTIDSGSWPFFGGKNLVGYPIYFSSDSYVSPYIITAQTSTTLTIASAPGNGTGLGWIVRGLPVVDGGRLLLGDNRGYVLKFDPDVKSDLTVDTSVDADSFKTQAIVPHYISSAVRAPDTRFNIWVSRIYATFKNLTGSLSLDLEGYDDDSSTAYALKSVRKRSITGVHKVERWWRKGKLESLFKQFGIKKGTVNIVWSDDYDTATISSTTVSLDSGSWPTYESDDLVGYSIYFSSDSYATGYTITAVSGANITVDSAPGDAAGLGWEIKGIPKTEGFHLREASLELEVLGECYKGHRSTDDGGNS